MDDEIAFHLEMRTRERIAAGESAEEARRGALARFGEVDAARVECMKIQERRQRRMRRANLGSALRQDITYAVRSLRRSPGFAAVAVLTLALGIGANSAIFSVVNGVLLESLPYAEPHRLMTVETLYSNGKSYSLSAPDFMSVVEENRVFRDVTAYRSGSITMTGRGEAREAQAVQVGRRFFEVVGIRAVAGRAFTEEEHVPGSGSVVALTEGFAERVFGGVRQALNQTLTLAGRPFVVVGVMAAGSALPEDAEMYMPLSYDSTFSAATDVARRAEFLRVVGRAGDDVTPAQVEQDMRRLGADLAERFAQTNQNLTFTSFTLNEKLLGSVDAPLLVLLGAVGLVLLVACANVANLMLARATSRESELAVRAALGAGRGSLLRQLLVESLVLAMAGAALGLLLAWLGTRALIAAQPADVPRLANVAVDGTVVAYTAVLAIATGLLFGTLPALQATSRRMLNALRESGRGALGGVRGQRMRAAIVVSEIGLAVVLLVGAGLLIRSFREMMQVDAGFRAENAVALRVSLQGPAYNDPASREQFFTQLEERLRALPGVTAVGAAQGLPMTGVASILGPFSVEGQEETPAGLLPEIRVITVTPGYFAAIGTPLLAGRPLDSRDRADAPRSVLINRSAVERWFGGDEAVGRRVVLGNAAYEIVGVVGDVLQREPHIPVEPEMYLAYSQDRVRTMRWVVRGGPDVLGLADRMRAEVHALDADLPVTTLEPLTAVVSAAVARPRFYTALLTLFAGVALTLAVVGIFGVMSYLVAQRNREIGIRMALGADAGRVVALVVGAAMKVALVGVTVGIAGALVAGGVLRSQLFGVGVADPLTLAGVFALFLACAFLASFLPARRAARTQPSIALRGD